MVGRMGFSLFSAVRDESFQAMDVPAVATCPCRHGATSLASQIPENIK